jgi:hypothetical protein
MKRELQRQKEKIREERAKLNKEMEKYMSESDMCWYELEDVDLMWKLENICGDIGIRPKESKKEKKKRHKMKKQARRAYERKMKMYIEDKQKQKMNRYD